MTYFQPVISDFFLPSLLTYAIGSLPVELLTQLWLSVAAAAADDDDEAVVGIKH